MWELDYKESWAPKNWCCWTVVLEKTLESLLDCKEIQPSILKEISPEYSLEGLMLMLKLQYFGHLMWTTDTLKGPAEDGMVGWYHQLDGHEFEQAPGVGDRQGSLACCSPWGRKESDTTERLNWTGIMLNGHIKYRDKGFIIMLTYFGACPHIFRAFLHIFRAFFPTNKYKEREESSP